MDRRKRLLVNGYEEATHRILEDAASKSGARVFPKVRMADALDIERSGITPQQYSYALKAHFDFLVTTADYTPQFAVEFDGPQHATDSAVIARDALKNSLCEKLGLPLLRIGAEYLRQVGRFRLIGWLTEVWFLYVAFCEAQQRGELPEDEIFHYSFFLGLGYIEDGRIIEIDTSDASATLSKAETLKQAKVRVVTTRPYDPFIEHRAYIQHLHKKGLCSRPVPECIVAWHPEGHYVAAAFVELPDGRTVIGNAQCNFSSFPAVPPLELCEELAVLDAGEKLRKYLKGEYRASSHEEVSAWRGRLSHWRR